MSIPGSVLLFFLRYSRFGRDVSPEEFSNLVVNLPQAESLDLYRLEYIIRALYSEPKRTIAARVKINLGMEVEYFDSRVGAFHRGRIARTQDSGVTIDDADRKLRLSGVPYAALNLSGASIYAEPGFLAEPRAVAGPGNLAEPGTMGERDAPAEMDRPPPVAKREPQFKIGDRVWFMDRDYRRLMGTVVRVNAKSVSVDADNHPGHWRVSPGLLTQVIER